MEATLRLKRSFSLRRYRPEQRVGLSLVSLAPLIAQVEFDCRDVPASSRSRRIGRLGLLALILTVAAVQTVGATIMPECFGNRGFLCRGTESSNPSPSSRQSVSLPQPLLTVENP